MVCLFTVFIATEGEMRDTSDGVYIKARTKPRHKNGEQTVISWCFWCHRNLWCMHAENPC